MAVTMLGVLPPAAAEEGATTFYFAEGTVRPGFVTLLVLFNPSQSPVRAEVAFAAADAAGAPVGVPDLQVDLAPRSRATRDIAEHVADAGITEPVDVAMEVKADGRVVVERTVYFRSDLLGGVAGGTTTTGVPEPGTEWYFAEGSTHPGLLTFLAVYNPGSEAAAVTVAFGPSDRIPLGEVARDVPPGSRVTIDVNAEVGEMAATEVGMTVTSDQPVVAERTMFFNLGLLDGVAGGSTVAGSPTVARSWFLAGGTVTPDTATFLSVYNPNDNDARIELRARSTADDEDDEEFPTIRQTVPARSRATFDLRDDLAALAPSDIAVTVEANRPVVVERTTFLRSDLLGGIAGGTTTMGATRPSRGYTFAEGTLRPGFASVLHIDNPNDRDATVRVDVVAVDTAGDPVVLAPIDVTVPAESVLAYDLAQATADAGAVDVSLQVLSNRPVVASRTVLFRTALAGGATGATAGSGWTYDVRDVIPLWLIILGVAIGAVALGAVAVAFLGRREPDQPESEPQPGAEGAAAGSGGEREPAGVAG